MNGWQNGALPTTAERTANCGASPNKVSEVFIVAGQAFQKLGGLIATLQNQSKNGSDRKWTDSDASNLHDAVSRFANELQRISESVQEREVQLMKGDIMKRPLSQSAKTTSPGTSCAPSTTSTTPGAAKPPMKRASSVIQPSLDVAAKRRVITTVPSGITVSSTALYTGSTHLQTPNSKSPIACRRSGSISTVPTSTTVVNAQSSVPSVMLPPEPISNMVINNGML